MDMAAGAQPRERGRHGSTAQTALAPQSPEALPVLRKSKSIRVRPNEMLEKQEAVPRLPLKDSGKPRELQPRSSKMSLFNLFSKPKVEKLRGYSEAGTQHLAPPAVGVSKSATVSESNLPAHRREASRDRSTTRPTSSRSQSAHRAAKLAAKERVPPLPNGRRSAPFSPPPLFQAYPQSTKHGVLEVPAAVPDAILQKSKSQRPGSLQTASVETVRKIFVLVTSGYLLQYAYDGPSDRQPEKILELGKESAAFACDLIPGKHFVLQVSHAVNRQGAIVPSSTSLLTRLGLRGNTSRRMISNCFLILDSAEEINSWMMAIRHEIEIQGGSVAHIDPVPTSPQTQEHPPSELQKTHSTSHRYQVKRDPSKVMSIASPSDQDTFPTSLTPTAKVDDDSVETATIDDIEVEASTLGNSSDATRTRATSDAQSAASSAAQSIEQQQLEKIRNSIRISHASSLTTGLTSRTNSPTSSHPSDMPSKGPTELSADLPSLNAPYRSASAYASGKRRSLAPLMLSKDDAATESGKVDGPVNQQRRLESPIHSPTIGHQPASLQSPPQRLSMAQSAPDLKANGETKRRHDSKLHSPVIAASGERPESVLGDLPSPSALASKTSPKLRHSSFPLAQGGEPLNGQPPRRPASQIRNRASDTARQSIGPSTSFSLPLKINAPDQPSARSVRRASQIKDQADVASPVPVVHTLTAKVDLTTRTTISTAHIPPRTSSTVPFGMEAVSGASRNANSRLSLFPSQPPPFPQSFQGERIRRSPSTSALSSQAPPQAAGTALRRPTSMQVRSNHAPFLSSVRNSTQALPVVAMRPGTTVPIRSLKPSRSSVMMQSSYGGPAQDPFYEAKLASVALNAEASDRASPLPLPYPSPSFSTPTSRRTSRIRSGVLLDLGMPLANLGPPAPPPQAPLPEIPTASKPSSPTDDSNPPGRTFLHTDSPPQPGSEFTLGAS